MGKKAGKIRKFSLKRKDEYFFDYSLLLVVLFLMGFGLVMIYSASSYDASTSKSFNYDAAYFLKKQAFASVLGIVAMFAVTIIPYRFWERFAFLGYIVSAVLIVLVLTPLGIEAMKRLKVGGGNCDTATNEMVTFVVINTASIQLIPTTTAVLRAEYGSSNPMSIMPAVLLSSFCSLIVGLMFDKILRGKNND